jgi:hypothetical protein
MLSPGAKKSLGHRTKQDANAIAQAAMYNAMPADPLSTQFQKKYTIEQSLAVSRNTDRCSLGQLRIAHNSLYAEANRIDDEVAMQAAFVARERLWNAILIRDRR